MSSAPAHTTSSSSHSSDRSSILRSSFAPSVLQLHLFASVIQSFDSQQLRIHDTNTGRLRQQHAARTGTSITSLDWGHYGTSRRDDGQANNKKKRKRSHAATEDAVIAYGTSASEICMYSPAEGRVVGTLSGTHEGSIKDFRFSSFDDAEGWSIASDGKLVQWDLSKNLAIRSVVLPDVSVSLLSSPSQQEPRILCASTSPLSVYPSDDFRIESFNSFKGQVRNLQRSGRNASASAEFFLAADDDRYINVFDIGTRKLVRTLVTGSEVEQLHLSLSDNAMSMFEEDLLAVVTGDGVVELFPRPFELPTAVNGDLKSAHKNKTRKATARVKLIDSSKSHARIFSASIQGPELLLVSIDGGIDPAFQKVRWQDEGSGELLFEGVKEVLKIKSLSTLNAAQMNGVKDMGKTHIDESSTVVVNGIGDLVAKDETIEISSGDEEVDEESEDEPDAEAEVAAINDAASSNSDGEAEQSEALALTQLNNAQDDTEMRDVEDTEPTFGDLLAARHPNAINIADTFQPEKSSFDASKQLALPSGMSLGTVLTQALRTNDTNLLESCLHANDAHIIRNTMQRLDPALAVNLLSRLAERLASRPGRYGHLVLWVQWTCIKCGGAIAGQSDVASKIKSLYRVLTQRSKSLDKLLLLQGKLDMLDSQLTERKRIRAEKGTHDRDVGEPGMIYIEGGEDNWSSDEDIDEEVGVARSKQSKKSRRRALEDLVREDATSEDGDDDDEMPTTNGVAEEDSEEEDEPDEEAPINGRKNGGLYDEEAEVSDVDGISEEDDDDDDASASEGDDDENDEDDSSMESFINDGEISVASEEDVLDLDDEPDIRRPEKKKSKHR